MRKNDDVEAAMDFEKKLSNILGKSNNRAWFITFLSLFLTMIIATLYIYKPIVKTIPYVIKVDSEGVPSLLTSVDSKKITIDEGLDKYFTKEYVKRREGYYYSLIEEDYLYVQLLSNERVSKEYRSIYEGEDSRDKILKDTATVAIKIISITLGESAGVKNATIRLKAITKKDNTYDVTKHHIINLSYEYNPDSLLNEKDRLINPLGFKVITYRDDEEIE